MFVTTILAFVASLFSQYHPSKQTRDLWTRAYCSWHILGPRPNPGDDLRSASERRADLGKSFRNLATLCIPLAQKQIDMGNDYIKMHKHSTDADIQDIVKSCREHLVGDKEILKWYQGLLVMPYRGPIRMDRP